MFSPVIVLLVAAAVLVGAIFLTLVAVWMENPHGPFEMVLEETPETQSEAASKLAYIQESQSVP